jgi:hypothetical protein
MSKQEQEEEDRRGDKQQNLEHRKGSKEKEGRGTEMRQGIEGR